MLAGIRLPWYPSRGIRLPVSMRIVATIRIVRRDGVQESLPKLNWFVTRIVYCRNRQGHTGISTAPDRTHKGGSKMPEKIAEKGEANGRPMPEKIEETTRRYIREAGTASEDAFRVYNDMMA